MIPLTGPPTATSPELELSVTFLEGRRHLPLIELRKAARKTSGNPSSTQGMVRSSACHQS
jgi:hypothetical protein